jgi:hypothetical protein
MHEHVLIEFVRDVKAGQSPAPAGEYVPGTLSLHFGDN